MKQVFENEIKTLLRGGSISNLSLDTLFVFLFYLYKHGGRFLVLGNNTLVSECVKRKRFFGDVFYISFSTFFGTFSDLLRFFCAE